MGYRHRTKVLRACSAGLWEVYAPGFVTGPVSSTPGFAGITRYKTSDDYTSIPPYVVPNPLTLMDYDAAPGFKLSGTIPDGIFEYRYNQFSTIGRSSYTTTPETTAVNWLYWQTKALANLNPSAPKVDLPLFLFEFKDFPAMLKNLGDVLGNKQHPRDIPEGYLAYSFGWAPLVSDLMKLLEIQKSIEDRKRYLRALEGGTHIRRQLGSGVLQHVFLPDGFNMGVTNWTLTPIFVADVTIVEKQKVWFTANAKLLTDLPAVSSPDELATVLSLGLVMSPSTLWNMVPWSWLIDYFFNIGDLLESLRGWIPLSVPQMCIMARNESSSTLTNIRKHPGISWSGGTTIRRTAKQRHVVYEPMPFLTADPFLSFGQMANLGALGVAAALKSKGFGGAR
jgi:hypothetical protein